MGFGTGHHATTRLCLDALQSIDLAGRAVLDVGTGSGVLAIAAARLGAGRVLGIDNDADALASARENLRLNPEASGVESRECDLADLAPPPRNPRSRAARPRPPLFDVITANLTGALLVREAAALMRSLAPHALLILSGLLATEREAVAAAFGRLGPVRESSEDEWVCLVVKNR